MSHLDPDFREAWFDFDRFLNYCNCPATGSFVGWKGAIVFHGYDCRKRGIKAEYCLVHLGVPVGSRRLRAKSSKKCRCEFAEVLDIQKFDGSSFPVGTVAYSIHEINHHEINDHHFYDLDHYKTRYKIGERVYADSFDDDREIECSHGIHFFMSRDDALAYIGG